MTPPSSITVSGLNVVSDQTHLLKSITFSLRPGQVLGVIGPNGAGKTTLLSALSGQLSLNKSLSVSGDIKLGPDKLESLSLPERARRIAVVNQLNNPVFQLTLGHVVSMGGLVHQPLLHRRTKQDEITLQNTLESVGLKGMATRLFHQLSGGEQQRGLIARALLQQSGILILDEPINHLDVYYQHQILQLLSELAKTKSLTIIVSLHDLNLAADYCDQLCLLNRGEAICFGESDKVLKPELLSRVYQLQCERIPTSEKMGSRVVFYPNANRGPQL